MTLIVYASYQVEQREEENPHDIDEVPVEAEMVHGFIVAVKIVSFEGFRQQISNHYKPSNDVHTVYSSGNVVACGGERIVGEYTGRSDSEFLPFERLVEQEGGAQRECSEKAQYQPGPGSCFGRNQGHNRCEAASQKDERVYRSTLDAESVEGRPCYSVDPYEHVRSQKNAEEDDFGGEEGPNSQPHPGNPGEGTALRSILFSNEFFVAEAVESVEANSDTWQDEEIVWRWGKRGYSKEE